MMEFSDKKKLVSEYNEAGFQMMRLNNLWQQCNDYAIKGDLNNWKSTLHIVWTELAADGMQLNKDFYVKAIRAYDDKILNAQSRGHLYSLLESKHIFLKNLQESAGKGSKKKAEYEDAFD